MRRSAAPSFRTDSKRARFIPHIFKNVPCDKENKYSDNSNTSLNSNANGKISNFNHASPTELHGFVEPKACGANEIRTNEDILDLIFDDSAKCVDSKVVNNVPNVEILSADIAHYSRPIKASKTFKTNICESVPQNVIVDYNTSLSSCIYCIKNREDTSLFNVLWCKRSAKKHKTWEGDGVLIVRNRSAVLKDNIGKVLDRGVGYKLKEIESIEDNGKFFIGGKECEIQCKISQEECESGKYCKCGSKSELPVKQETIKTEKPC